MTCDRHHFGRGKRTVVPYPVSAPRARLRTLFTGKTGSIRVAGGADPQASRPWTITPGLLFEGFSDQGGHGCAPLRGDHPQALEQFVRNRYSGAFHNIIIAAVMLKVNLNIRPPAKSVPTTS